MEFRRIPALNEEKAATSLTNSDIDLTDEELKFELNEKIKILNKLFGREIADEDTLPAHLV